MMPSHLHSRGLLHPMQPCTLAHQLLQCPALHESLHKTLLLFQFLFNCCWLIYH